MSPPEKNRMLYTAAEKNDVKSVEILPANGADIETICNGFTALHIASSYGHYKIVELLLDCGAKLNISSLSEQTPLSSIITSHGARFNWNPPKETIIILIRYGADINCHPFPLCQAVQMGRLHLVKLLLEKGANTEVIDRREQTPYYMHARNSKHTICWRF